MDAPLGGCYIHCYLLSLYQLAYISIDLDTLITRACKIIFCVIISYVFDSKCNTPRKMREGVQQ